MRTLKCTVLLLGATILLGVADDAARSRSG
jgi:hypothetical protein